LEDLEKEDEKEEAEKLEKKQVEASKYDVKSILETSDI
jgi:hypothetical protein